MFSAAEIPAIRARLQGPLKAIGDSLRAGVDGPFQGSGFPKTPDLNYAYFDDRRSIADTLAAYAFAATIYGPDATD